jgi:Zn-dependent protease
MNTDIMLEIGQRLMIFVPLLLSLTVHEWAHARAAMSLGDYTAEEQGRCTLLPFPHIDIVGTVILPLLGVPFGWAKPVPVNPLRFTRAATMRRGMMLTSIAGPLANAGLALTSVLLLVVMVRLIPGIATAVPELRRLLVIMVKLNVVLALFNLLPIPPLDGSRVADYLMPASLRPHWESVYGAGPYMLIGLVLFLSVSGVSIFAVPLYHVHRILLVLGVL